MELKFNTDGWSQWFEHEYAPKAPSFVKVGMYLQYVGGNGGVGEGFITQVERWQWVKRFRIRKPKGLALLEESMYKLNTVGNYEQKLIGVDK